jgi:hypothetical protein
MEKARCLKCGDVIYSQPDKIPDCNHRIRVFEHSGSGPDFSIAACRTCRHQAACFCDYCRAVEFGEPDDSWLPKLGEI